MFSVKLQSLQATFILIAISSQLIIESDSIEFPLRIHKQNNSEILLASIGLNDIQEILDKDECLIYFSEACTGSTYLFLDQFDYQGYDALSINESPSEDPGIYFLKKNRHKHIIVITDKGIPEASFDQLKDEYNQPLIINYSISYQLSISEFYYSRIDCNHEQQKDPSFAAYSFGSNHGLIHSVRSEAPKTHTGLLCSDKEIIEIVETIGVTNFELIQNACDLVRQLQKSKVIHLATHTDNVSGEIKLQIANSLFGNSDIESLDLRNELIVLSACETAKEQIDESKGMISLARSFLKAGARSVLVSLDTVDDCSTADLMQKFYAFLKLGIAKDDALRFAKIDFVQQAHPERRDPYFWTNFIIVGDCRPIY